MSSVAAILQQLAENAGRKHQQRGALIGNTIADLSQVPGQMMVDREREALVRQQQQRMLMQDSYARDANARANTDQRMQDTANQEEVRKKAAVQEVLKVYTKGTPNDPRTNDLNAGLAKIQELGIPEFDDPLRKIHAEEQKRVREAKEPPKSMTTNDLAVLGMNANPVVSAFGQGVLNLARAPVKPPAPPAVGSFEDYSTATPERKKQIEADRKAYQQADDRPRITVNAGNPGDVKEYVAGMKDGTLPPVMPGRASKDYTAIGAEAKRQGFDLGKANLDWAATQKHVATMNGAQQLRLNQAINALPEMLDNVSALSSKWKGGRFPILNKANLALAKGGAYGQEVASVANQLDAQIADVVADLGNVYMGGNSPTDHALGLAGKSLAGEWSDKVLQDMVTLAKKNVVIRRNSIATTGVAGASADNPYDNPAPAAHDAPPARIRYDMNGNVVK